MRTTCPHCNGSGNIKDEALGKKITCPRCKNVFVVKADSTPASGTPTAPPQPNTRRPVPPVPSEPAHPCSQCLSPTQESELADFNGTLVCSRCKAVYLQKMREGVVTDQNLKYAGFWIRVWAKFIDGFILGLVSGVLNGALQGALLSTGDNQSMALALTILSMIINLSVGITYVTYLVGKYGATPGKMALGLKIIKPDGESLTYLQAFGRYWAELLSSIILGIGYLMVAFDDESRSLHDRICETRVIRTR